MVDKGTHLAYHSLPATITEAALSGECDLGKGVGV